MDTILKISFSNEYTLNICQVQSMDDYEYETATEDIHSDRNTERNVSSHARLLETLRWGAATCH